MAIDLELRRTNESEALVPTRVGDALAAMAKLEPPRAAMRGQELRLALGLPLDDDAGAAFLLGFPAQGARVEATARGRSEALLVWAFHAIAAKLGSELVVDGASVPPEPSAHRAAAVAYLEAYEADLRTSRKERAPIDGAAFVSWLAREEHIALGEGGPPADLSLDDAPRLYEALLESDVVEDVFVGEREMARLLTRFKARAVDR